MFRQDARRVEKKASLSGQLGGETDFHDWVDDLQGLPCDAVFPQRLVLADPDLHPRESPGDERAAVRREGVRIRRFKETAGFRLIELPERVAGIEDKLTMGHFRQVFHGLEGKVNVWLVAGLRQERDERFQRPVQAHTVLSLLQPNPVSADVEFNLHRWEPAFMTAPGPWGRGGGPWLSAYSLRTVIHWILRD